ncbi:MAG: glycoside hydrolase family 99-like domain-containing protein [Actinobacteria bacterium]|nr:glycoside hydrolase family 99-like domain-containing protein [Actinomycetota bacterium]MBU1945161.1 glycoside hydrolase family 99-like domain-containing protein [Actinomycetota bacterium]MBU2687699.1 glycoside hydrolase family 99-like domain-containing protein [Actinomycetota bacterium]
MRTLRATVAVGLLAALLAVSAGCGGGPTSAEPPVRCFVLEVRLTTTAEAARAKIEGGPGVLSLRVLDRGGGVTRAGANADSLWARREAGGEDDAAASVTVEYLLGVGSCDGLAITGEQRAGGTTTIEAADVTGGAEARVESLSLGEGSQATSRPIGALFAGVSPKTVARERPVEGTPALAFHYPWYGSQDDWSNEILSDRPAQPYVSDDEAAIRRQIEQAKGAGLDGFISSWWGPGTYTDENLALLLEVASEEGFRVAVNFETLADKDEQGKDAPIEEARISKWLEYLLVSYGDHPAMMEVEGKPLVFLWASDAVELEAWRRVLGGLERRGHDASFIGMVGAGGPPAGSLDVFDGLHVYNPLGLTGNTGDVGMLKAEYAETGSTVRYYNTLAGGRPRIWAPTAMPGYDDDLIPDREGIVVPRDDGAYYRSCLQAAIDSEPDILLVTSWNEWWEHTYIEPSQRYDDRFLELTAEGVGDWRD